jgi:ribosome modulation factor
VQDDEERERWLGGQWHVTRSDSVDEERSTWMQL